MRGQVAVLKRRAETTMRNKVSVVELGSQKRGSLIRAAGRAGWVGGRSPREGHRDLESWDGV